MIGDLIGSCQNLVGLKHTLLLDGRGFEDPEGLQGFRGSLRVFGEVQVEHCQLESDISVIVDIGLLVGLEDLSGYLIVGQSIFLLSHLEEHLSQLVVLLSRSQAVGSGNLDTIGKRAFG